MARVRDIDVDELSSELKQEYEQFAANYGPFINQLKVYAHRPAASRHIMGLLLEFSNDVLLPKRHLELALLVVSRMNECQSCIKYHTPELISEGFSQETVENILRPDCPGLDELDRLVRDYSILVTESANRIPDAFFDRLRKYFSDSQIVELTLRIAMCGFFNRFNAALQIEEEDEAQAMLASIQKL